MVSSAEVPAERIAGKSRSSSLPWWHLSTKTRRNSIACARSSSSVRSPCRARPAIESKMPSMRPTPACSVRKSEVPVIRLASPRRPRSWPWLPVHGPSYSLFRLMPEHPTNHRRQTPRKSSASLAMLLVDRLHVRNPESPAIIVLTVARSMAYSLFKCVGVLGPRKHGGASGEDR